MKPTLFSLLALTAAVSAGPRASMNYAVVTDTADTGGKRSASAAYTNDGSAGGVVGISDTAVGGRVRAGYTGQLYETTTGFSISTSTTTVEEGSSIQIRPLLLLDDNTFLVVPYGDVAWSVSLGPISINAAGLATAGAVYQNTVTVFQGSYGGSTSEWGVTVLDTNRDNYGSYASDGLDDAWQVLYFGLNNPQAGPLLDPDGDTQTNLFEFNAGVIPTDPNSAFRFRLEDVPGQPGQRKIVFSPSFADRSYTVKSSTTLLSGSFAPMENFSASSSGNEHTVTDLSAGVRKFYQIEITKP